MIEQLRRREMALQIVTAVEGTVWHVGGPITCKISSEDTGGSYAVLDFLLPPGGGAPRHSHKREDELIYVAEGACDFDWDSDTATVEAGGWVRIPQGQAHAFRNTGTDACRLLITVIPGGLDHYFAELNDLISRGEATADRVAALNVQFELDFQPE
jgi:quercetin dioxygenase-like cupin family protein